MNKAASTYLESSTTLPTLATSSTGIVMSPSVVGHGSSEGSSPCSVTTKIETMFPVSTSTAKSAKWPRKSPAASTNLPGHYFLGECGLHCIPQINSIPEIVPVERFTDSRPLVSVSSQLW